MNQKTKLTHLGTRAATDSAGNWYELAEFSELSSTKTLAGWSAWEPRNGHGQAMALNGKPLERITDLQWETSDCPPLRLTLQPR